MNVEIWRLPRVREKTGIGTTTIYRMMKAGDFPKPRPIGKRAVGWNSKDVQQWINERMGEVEH